MSKYKPKIFCLMGPTATGKSDLALKLAKYLPLEIVSVDSAMVYAGMDIGTTKPAHCQLKATPHHLIDICDPGTAYSAGRFLHDSSQKIQEIFARGNIPLLVGGTMLYFHILQQGLSSLPEANPAVRAKLQEQKEQFGLDVLYKRLQEIDPESASRINKADSQRIQRVLEIYELTGQSLSKLHTIPKPYHLQDYEVVNIILVPQNPTQHLNKIKIRFNEMLQLGFIEEVKKLYRRGDLQIDMPAIRTVGYRQVWQYLSGQTTYSDMLMRIPVVTRQLAKRQLTWLKKWDSAHRFDSCGIGLLDKILNLMH